MNTGSWRIGVLFSRSGVTAAIETTQANATMLAVEEINAAGGVLGRLIEPVSYDPASSPRQFRSLAHRLLTEDGVRILFGCYMSSTRKAVLPEIEAHRGLLFYPTLYEGFEYSPRCIYTGAAPNQNSLPLAKFLMETYGTRFLLVGSNYVFPYESNRVMADLVTQAKGRVVDEIYVPLEAEPADFERVVARIRKLEPAVVFSTVVGTGTAMLYEAYRRAGFDPVLMPIASLTTSEAEIAEMAPEIAEGHVTAEYAVGSYTSFPYFQAIDTDVNKAFVERYRAYVNDPNAVTHHALESSYFQVFLWAQAVAKAEGELTTEAIREAVKGQEYDAPNGHVKIEPENLHTYLTPRIAEWQADGQGKIIDAYPEPVFPLPYVAYGETTENLFCTTAGLDTSKLQQ